MNTGNSGEKQHGILERYEHFPLVVNGDRGVSESSEREIPRTCHPITLPSRTSPGANGPPRNFLLGELLYLSVSVMLCAFVVTLLMQTTTFEPKAPILFVGYVGGMLYGVTRFVVLTMIYMRR
jgi:hypothetical protein